MDLTIDTDLGSIGKFGFDRHLKILNGFPFQFTGESFAILAIGNEMTRDFSRGHHQRLLIDAKRLNHLCQFVIERVFEDNEFVGTLTTA